MPPLPPLPGEVDEVDEVDEEPPPPEPWVLDVPVPETPPQATIAPERSPRDASRRR
jgi:hypothetical protein